MRHSLKTVGIRQTHIKQYEIKVLMGYDFQGVAAIAANLDFITLAA